MRAKALKEFIRLDEAKGGNHELTYLHFGQGNGKATATTMGPTIRYDCLSLAGEFEAGAKRELQTSTEVDKGSCLTRTILCISKMPVCVGDRLIM